MTIPTSSRGLAFTAVVLIALGAPCARAADTIVLAPAVEEPGAASAVPAALARLAQLAPDYPPDLAPEVAANFADEVRRTRPAESDRVGQPGFDWTEFDAALLRAAAVRAKGPKFAALRGTLAERRAAALLRGTPGVSAASVLARLQRDSEPGYRRFSEGRMEDDEFVRLASGADARRAAAPRPSAAPKELTAADIAAEFSRRNQEGTTTLRLRAFSIEAQLRKAGGAVQEVRLFKLRPNLFRLHVETAGEPAQIVGFDGTRYWRQEGARVVTVPAESIGDLRHLAEFLDPLFDAGNVRLERLPDGAVDGHPVHRLRVTRSDGSGYVAQIGTTDFRELGREHADGSTVRFSDFRSVAGVTHGFREEQRGVDGRVTTLEIRQLQPNPGLIAAFFAVPGAAQLDLGPIEQFLARTSTP